MVVVVVGVGVGVVVGEVGEVVGEVRLWMSRGHVILLPIGAPLAIRVWGVWGVHSWFQLFVSSCCLFMFLFTFVSRFSSVVPFTGL